MKHVSGLIIKFVVVTAILWTALAGYGVSIGSILFVGILLSGILFIGDLFMLPRMGNLSTAVADLGLSFITIWGVGTFLFAQPMPLITVSLISAFVIAFAELPIHLYMAEQVLTVKHSKSHETDYSRREMLTEFGAEFEIKEPVKKDEK